MRGLVCCLFVFCFVTAASGDQSNNFVLDDPVPTVSLFIISPATRGALPFPEGKEVDAIDGDAILCNDHITAVIAKPVEGRNANLTTNDVGGCLLDLTTTKGGSDQLAVFRPHGKSDRYRAWRAVIGNDEVELEGETDGWGGVTSQASIVVSTLDGQATATYTLGAVDKFLTVTIEATGGTKLPPAEFRIDGGGNRVQQSPQGEEDWYWAEDVHWGQSYAVTAADGGDLRISKIGRAAGLMEIDREIATRQTLKLTAGPNRLVTRHIAFPDVPTGTLGGQFFNDLNFRMSPLDVVVKTRQESGSETIAAFRQPMGDVANFPLPTGPIRIEASFLGRSLNPFVAFIKRGTTVTPRWHLGDHTRFHNKIGLGAGFVRMTIRDADGWPIPAKVQIHSVGEAATLHFGPDSAESQVHNLLYVADGAEDVTLPAGTYDFVVSRGPEYHRTIERVTVAAGATRPVNLVLERAFSTLGWISTDYHSHSSPSGDNISSQRGRVLNLVCEDIDFAPCTEHNRVSSYQGHIDDLGLGGEIASCSGMELTGSQLPINHQNVFPMVHKPFTQNGGGPYVADNPDDQIERLFLWDERSEKVIQQDHPDIGWLFRDRDGDGNVDEGFARGVNLLDCIEVHPIESVLELFPDAAEARGEAAKEWNRGRFLGWLQLLNQGRRLPGVVNTDAHYNYHGSGWLRNWIQVPNDEPGEVELEDIMAATKEGRIIMSNGPMIELELEAANETKAGIGDELAAKDGKVRAHIRVRCADWVHCNRVALLVDGRPELIFDVASDFNHDDVVVFEQTVDVTVEHDAPVLAICGSTDKTLGEVYGPDNAERHFAAATNPIWVNVGDDGWKPSNDDLGVPLTGKKQ